MGSYQFSFRRYKDEDASNLYQAYQEYTWENIQPYYSVGIGMDKAQFLEAIRKYSNKVHRPPIIVDENDVPFGVYHLSYRHANRYHELAIHLWNHQHLTKAILQQILDQVLHEGHPEAHLLLEVPGYAPKLHKAAYELGLEHIGTVPQYLCHGAELFDKYIYVVTSEKWNSNEFSDL